MTNPSLQKKTAARMVAVQSLYQQSISGDARIPSEEISTLKEHLKDNRDEQKMRVGQAVEPNYALVETLLGGVAAQQQEITMRLSGALSAEWSLERMSPLLVAILQCAIFEMFFAREIKPAIVIDEYTKLTRRFFNDREVNFVHGALATLAQQYT